MFFVVVVSLLLHLFTRSAFLYVFDVFESFELFVRFLIVFRIDPPTYFLMNFVPFSTVPEVDPTQLDMQNANPRSK